MQKSHADLRQVSPAELRAVLRDGAYTGHTAGLARGFLQTNLVILPERAALDFMRYCQRNPKPCPLVGVSDTGNPRLFTLGHDLDVRTDVPAYNVYRDGRLDETLDSIEGLWAEDMVAFALGCSFTFEHALQAAGITVWNVANNTTVSMYRSNIQTVPAGPFHGATVVSMRPIPEDRLEDVIAISRKYPLAHGGPLHVGDPAAIGIPDPARPDWGDPAEIAPGTVPVFWACGVTPQVAIETAGLSLCITHRPGAMLVTDVAEDAEVPVLRRATAAVAP